MAFSNTAEAGVASGTTVTQALSDDGTAGTQLAIAPTVDTGGSIQFHSSAAYAGSLGYRITHPASGTGANRLRWSNGGTTASRYGVGFAFKIDSVPTQIEDVCQIRHAGGNTGLLVIATDGKLQIQNAAGSNVATLKATTALSANHWYWISMIRLKGTGTGDGTLGFAYYDLEASGLPLVQSLTSSTVDAGTADTSEVGFGRTTGRTQAHVCDYDNVSGDVLASGFVAPTAANPTVTQYDAVDVFTVTAGTAPYGIAQDSGTATSPTVLDDGTVSGQGVFAVAKHTTSTLVYTITDDNGVEVDSLTVDPLPAASVWPKIPTGANPGSSWA